MTTLESLGPNFRQAVLIERACRSPTHLTDATAGSRAFFYKSALRLVDCNGSNGGPFRAFSMVGKSQGGTVQGRGGFILLVPRKNWINAHQPASNRGMETSYGCRANFAGGWGTLLSSISCRNERTTDTSEVTGSKSPRGLDTKPRKQTISEHIGV